MIFDLHPEEAVNDLNKYTLSDQPPPPGMFKNFIPGAAEYTVQGVAQGLKSLAVIGAGTLSSPLGPIGAISESSRKLGEVSLSDRWFKGVDEAFQPAIDKYTPKPDEVGAAGQIVGQLASTLLEASVSPAVAVAAAQAKVSTDAIEKGASVPQAVGLGGVEGAATALGLWMPILGKTYAQRVLVGGVASNVVNQAATQGYEQAILANRPDLAKEYELSLGSLGISALMGAAFGHLPYLPGMKESREHGAQVWDQIMAHTKDLSPTEIAAMAVLREAQHKNMDSMSGRPATAADVGLHVEAFNKVFEDLANDKTPSVDGMKMPDMDQTKSAQAPDGQLVTGDLASHPAEDQMPTRQQQDAQVVQTMQEVAPHVAEAEGMEPPYSIAKAAEQQMLAAGRPPEEATALGQLHEALFNRIGQETGVGAEVAHRKYMNEITNRQAGAGALEQPAYHGSPHDFEQFSMDKIGTGEGAQAYGHGLYFAENPGIAKGYSERLSGFNLVDKNGNVIYSQEKMGYGQRMTPESLAATVLRESSKQTLYSPYAFAENKLRDSRGEVAPEALKVLAKWKEQGVKAEAAGKMYQVEIPDEHVAKMLDWDKPLGEQSSEVQKAFIKLMGGDNKNVGALKNKSLLASTGKDAYQDLGVYIAHQNGERIENSKEASAALEKEGITGIKYLDAGSRSKGEGSRNLVVFNDKHVEITHKNGEALTPAEKKELLQGGKENPRGYLSIDEAGKMTMGLLGEANASTALHETGHIALELISDLAAGEGPGAAWAQQHLKSFLEWAGGVKDIVTWRDMNLEDKRPYHEQFARGFEQYLREGNAPTKGLKALFQQFRDWLIQIYQKATDLNVKISDEMRALYGDLLTSKEQDPTGVNRVEGQAAESGAVPPPPAVSGELPGPSAPVTFKTSKGSTYEVQADGTTIRNKAARPEHPGEEGIQSQSKSTFYVSGEDSVHLSEVQAKGGAGAKTIEILPDGRRAGVKYLDGPSKGQFEGRTVVPIQREPALGLTPVETFGADKTVHFGNEITEVNQPNKLEGKEGEKVDPMAAEADLAAQKLPRIGTGKDAAGDATYQSAEEYLQAARDEAAAMRKKAQLFEVVANCQAGRE